MGIIYKNGVSKVIDRSIPELIKENPLCKESILISYCQLLKNIGVDIVEVNTSVLVRVEKLPDNIEFALRIEDEKDLKFDIPEKVKHVILKPVGKILNFFIDMHEKKQPRNIILEINPNDVFEIKKILESAYCKSKNHLISYRIVGLDKYMGKKWENIIDLYKNQLNLKVDICPGNNFQLATSVIIDVMKKSKIHYLSTSFMGIGGFAPLEEVLMAAKVILGAEVEGNQSILPLLKKMFAETVGCAVPDDKPIIGAGIFKYESGIHADGIEKNPKTYEPFEPNLVGQERKMIIGKHSGSKSLIKKLNELGVKHKADDIPLLLEKTKEASIILKREIFDYELKILYRGGSL